MPIIRGLVVVDGLILSGVTGNITAEDVDGGLIPYLKAANVTVPTGNTVANTATETAFSTAYTFPANSLAVGDVIVLELAGRFGTTILAPTIRSRIKFGGTTLLDTGALTLVANLTNSAWIARAVLTVDSLGASGWLECSGSVLLSTSATAALTVLLDGGQVIVDTTVDSALSITAQWGTADPANTITLRQYALDQKRAA